MSLQITSVNPASINATGGDVVELSCDVSGRLIYDSEHTTKRVWAIHYGVYSGKIYAGLGTNQGDAEVAVSNDRGLTWQTLYTHTNLRRIMSILEMSNGDVIYGGGIYGSGLPTEWYIYVNGLRDTRAGQPLAEPNRSFNVYDIVQSASGDVLAVGKGADGGVVQILYNGTQEWQTAYLSSDTESAYTGVVLTGDGGCYVSSSVSTKPLYSSDLVQFSPISELSSTKAIFGKLPNGDVVVYNNGSWLIESGGWASWSDAPTNGVQPWEKIGFNEYGIVVGDGNPTGKFAIYNGTSWDYQSLESTPDKVYIGNIIDNNDTILGLWSDGVEKTLITYRFQNPVQLSLLKNSTQVATGSPYQYTADPDDNGSSFVWEATDGVETVQSNAISITVSNGTGYGWTGVYGTGCYKGDPCIEPLMLTKSKLIEQFASPVINSSTIDFIPYVPSYNVNPSNDITPTEHILISQFRDEVIN